MVEEPGWGVEGITQILMLSYKEPSGSKWLWGQENVFCKQSPDKGCKRCGDWGLAMSPQSGNGQPLLRSFPVLAETASDLQRVLRFSLSGPDSPPVSVSGTNPQQAPCTANSACVPLN